MQTNDRTQNIDFATIGVGSLVFLKSGSPAMEVTDVVGEMAKVKWTQEDEFLIATLEQLTPTTTPPPPSPCA